MAGSRAGRQRHIEQGRKAKPFAPLAFVRRRGLLILALGGALAFAANLLFWPFVHPIYKTDGLLLVDPTKEPTLGGRERDIIPGNVGDYTRTLVTRLSGYDVIGAALRRLPATNYPAFLADAKVDPDRDVYRLMGRLKVYDVPRTYLIAATLSAPTPGGLGPTLNTILEVFVQNIQAEQEHLYARRLTYLRAERDQLQARIEEQRARLLALADSVQSKAFLHEAYTVHFSKVEQVQRLYWEAEAVRADKEGLLSKALADQQALAKLDLQPFADERVADNFGINRIEQWTYEQLQGMRAGIDGLTPENPDRQYVESRMESMNKFLESYKQRVNAETIRNLVEKRSFELEAEVLKARSAQRAAADTAGHLGQQLAQSRQDADAISEAIFQAADLSFAVSQLRDRLAALDNRIDDCELEAKAPVRIAINKRAITPDRPASSNRKTLMLLALALGFGSVLALVLGFDLLDNRIRSPREIELALGAPGPDPIASYVSTVVTKSNFARATLDAPDHPAVRAIRDLAVRLNFERERHGGRVFVFSGLNAQCGATTLAINVAHAFTAMCPGVLLVETNLARPGLRAALELPPGPGLETALRGHQPWTSLLRTEPLRGLRVLPAEGGARPPSHALIADILRESAPADGVVLVDAGCVLTDDVGYYAALHADAIILVAREDASLYRHLRRAIDQMVQAGVPALTAVLNQAQPLWLNRLLERMQESLGMFTRAHRYVIQRWERPGPGDRPGNGSAA